MEILAGAIGAVLGGIIAMLVQRLESQRLGRMRLTLDLYREWQSEALLKARVRANIALAANVSAEDPRSFMTLHDHCRDNGVTDDWIAITTVVHFLEQCGALAENRAIDMKLFRSLLGRYFIYWVDGYMRPWIDLSRRHDTQAELAWYKPVERLLNKADYVRSI